MADIVTPNEFKKNMCIRHKGMLMLVVDYHRGRTGMRRPYVNTKLKSIETGRVVEETFSSDDKFEVVFIDRRPMQYLYRSGDKFVFMDNETYEQPEVDSDTVSDIVDLLKENCDAFFIVADGKTLSVELPDFINLKVTKADPHIKGDTATAEYRKVEVETGAMIPAPTHVKEGDTIQIDTRTREYVKRV